MLDITFRNYHIIIGKNEEENDTLVEEAKPNDYWLHLSDYPSPHAIIKNPNEKRIHHKIIKRAAYLVKINSKYKSLSKVDVDVTKIKFIERTEKKGMVHVNEILNKINV